MSQSEPPRLAPYLEVEVEAAGGRAVVAHVGCCVFVCMCFVLWCEWPFSGTLPAIPTL